MCVRSKSDVWCVRSIGDVSCVRSKDDVSCVRSKVMYVRNKSDVCKK